MADIEDGKRESKQGKDKKTKKDKVGTEVKKILKTATAEDFDNEPVLTMLLEILQALQDIAKK